MTGPVTSPGATASSRLWYVSYGSNMSSQRLSCYVEGGRPDGCDHVYAGARDRTPPSQSIPLFLPGTVYFAGESSVWGGGIAYYDPDLPGRSAARAYLITTEQFTDIVAQELHRDTGSLSQWPGIDTLARTRRHQIGPGRYETLLYLGSRGGTPLLTFTAPDGKGSASLAAPSPAYRRVLSRGLREAHGWDQARVDAYIDDLVD